MYSTLNYRAIMLDVGRDNRVVSMAGKVGLKGNLVTMLDQLQRCQKSLNEFLEVTAHIYSTAKYFSGIA